MFNSLAEEINFFSINKNLVCKIEEIYQGQHIAIVDNFYKNPKKIQQLSLSIPPTYNQKTVSGVPGGRINITYFLNHLTDFFNQIINGIYCKDNNYDCSEAMNRATFCVNIVNQTDILPDAIPHMDGSEGFAVGIFLNNDEDCQGGTSFYTYKNKISPSKYPDCDLTPTNYPGYIMDDYKDFKKVYLAKMKFNRLIIYPKNLLHTAYIPKNSFNNEIPRLVQMFFI